MSTKTRQVTADTFQRDVLDADVPVLVDFYADWCAPCRAIAPAVDAVAGDFEGRAHVAKVNVDDSPDLAARYGIRGIPTLLVFKNGEAKESLVGAVGKPALVEALEKHTA